MNPEQPAITAEEQPTLWRSVRTAIRQQWRPILVLSAHALGWSCPYWPEWARPACLVIFKFADGITRLVELIP